MNELFKSAFLAAACVLGIVSFSSTSACADTKVPEPTRHSVEEWNTAIDDLTIHIKGVHPEPYAKIGRLEWERAADALKADVPRLSEEQRMVGIMRLVALLGDGHTQLQPDRADFGFWYPVRIVNFPDGYFITSALKGFEDLAGARVLKIGGRPIDDVAAAVRLAASADNEFGRRWNIGSLHNAILMHGLGFANADYSITIGAKLPNGKSVVRTLPGLPANDARYSPGFSKNDWEDGAETLGPPLGSPADWITAFHGEAASAFRVRNENHPVHLTLRRGLVTRNLPNEHAYYIQSNIVEDNFDESFHHLFFRAMDEIDVAKPRDIILDLRNNPGGDGSRIPELIPLLARHVSPQQNLYILTGPKTFSAAVLWLGDFIRYLHPSIVGEPAGAALNSFGDAHEYLLPQIGVSMHISTLRNVKSEVRDLSRLTPVDVPAPLTFADWSAGRDPAVDAILAGKEMRGLAQIAIADGADAARRTFLERAGKFAKFPWWTPPSEMDLRRAVQLLTEDGRYEDAIAIGEITIKLHPEIWNSWYGLGQAQLEAGRLIEGQLTLKKVLEVDPNNFNKDELSQIAARSPETEFTVPPILRWSGPLQSIEALAREQCTTTVTRTINPPFLNSVLRQQQQIDCDGFQYQSAARHLELIIRDNELVGAWLMMRPDEETRVTGWIQRDLGEAGIQQGDYVVFPKHLVAWRKSKAELLFYSPQLAAEVSRWFHDSAN